jgi:hypothetical protein
MSEDPSKPKRSGWFASLFRKPEPAAVVEAPLKALVIADLFEEGQAAATLLRALGLEVEVMLGGDRAILRLQSAPPDVLYLDCWETGLDGAELVKVAAYYTPELPRRVIARIPGGAASEHGVELVELGVRTIAPVRLSVVPLAEAVEQATGKRLDPAKVAAATAQFGGPETAELVDEFSPGDVIDFRYHVLSTLGRGAYAVVYEVTDADLGDTKLALKLLSPDAPGHDADQSLRREYEVARRIDHPNVVKAHDLGTCRGRPFVVFDVVRGLSLQDWIEDQGTLPVGPESLSLLAGGARAIEQFHRAGMVHRDIKPGNLLVDESTGLLKLIDFGVALLPGVSRDSTGQVMGTPSYVSPEQLLGETAGEPHSDLFSFGVVLYEILTGRRPFRGATIQQLLQRIATEPPTAPSKINPEVPDALSDAILLLLSKRPELRPLDVADVMEGLAGRSSLDIVPDTAAEKLVESLFDVPDDFD